MSKVVTSIAALEAAVGVPGLGVKMKVIDHLDEMAARWIAASPLAFAGAQAGDVPTVTLAGGPPGFAGVPDQKTLRLPLSAVDDPAIFTPGAGAGVLFLAHGVGETLRANGRVRSVQDGVADIAIEECFIHCAKALIRSGFWAASPAQAPAGSGAFVDAARFLAIATMDANGRIDISPKGDPAGLLLKSSGADVLLAERPGNKLAFGYRNILQNPDVAALAVIPGAGSVARITGRAMLSTDESLRGGFVVENRMPVLVTVIADARVETAPSAGLSRAALWSGEHVPAAIDPAEAFVAHVKLNKERGVQAAMMRLAVNRGLVESGLKHNYRTGLY